MAPMLPIDIEALINNLLPYSVSCASEILPHQHSDSQRGLHMMADVLVLLNAATILLSLGEDHVAILNTVTKKSKPSLPCKLP